MDLFVAYNYVDVCLRNNGPHTYMYLFNECGRDRLQCPVHHIGMGIVDIKILLYNTLRHVNTQ